MMHLEGIAFAILGLALFLIVPLLGHYIFLIFEGPLPVFTKPFKWLEHGIYRICQIDPQAEMNWKTYTRALLYFNLIGCLFLFLVLLLQGWLPFNPQHFESIPWPLALNITISFVSNTNWQSYTAENTLSYFTQMVGLTTQNFLSAATSLTIGFALIRGFTRRDTPLIGNFWSDLTRSIVYLLLPLSIILALILVSQGVIQNFLPYQTALTWENGQQIIPEGPAASQTAIQQLGTNGGGFFNANSAHPFANPTPLSNFFQLLALLSIPAALPYTFGLLVGSKRQGLTLFWVMASIWIFCLLIALLSEHSENPVLGFNPVFEGKEVRIGNSQSILWAISTTAASAGSVNALFDTLSPLASGMALFQLLLGDVVFGCVGTGLAHMIMYVLLTVFIAGLMVGRTPEYLGKKIEKKEIQSAIFAVLIPTVLVLIGSSLTLKLPEVLQNSVNSGPHGLTEIIYTFASTTASNGSDFGLNANTLFYNLVLALVMLLARLSIIIPSLVIAGSLAQKNRVITSSGTFRTDTVLFGILLTFIILILAGLTFFPALAVGPIVEQILMYKGQAF